jgi:hypothetical protein
MKEPKVYRIHFALLVIGTIFYLYEYGGMVTINNGISEADMLDVVRFLSNTMFYMIFVVLVFGHALLWSSPSKYQTLSDNEKEKIEEIKSHVEQKNKPN